MARVKTTTANGGSRKKQAPIAPAVNPPAEITRKTSATPDLEAEIRVRAYELYQERGCTPGHEDEDWILAERQVLARYQQIA